MEIWFKANITAHSFIPEQYWIKNYNIVEKDYLPVAKPLVYESGIIPFGSKPGAGL